MTLQMKYFYESKVLLNLLPEHKVYFKSAVVVQGNIRRNFFL